MSTVILCGMPDEKRVLQNALPDRLVLSGTEKLNLPKLLPSDCTRIVVAGLMGGLAPGIAVGDVCVASTIVDRADDIFACDGDWNDAAIAAAAAAGVTITNQPWYSSGLLGEADTVDQRRALYQRYGAACIDDEARFAVAEAMRRGIACNDFRACSDDHAMTLPPEARGAIMNADGSPNLQYLFKTLQLADVPLLTQIARDYSTSLDALETAAKACAAVFAT
jgi:adenosylhomocysteine nucleosidase